jgi:hypothetical protein
MNTFTHLLTQPHWGSLICTGLVTVVVTNCVTPSVSPWGWSP